MKLLLTTLAIVYLSLFMSLQAQEQVRVIPYPAEVTMQAETCKLNRVRKSTIWMPVYIKKQHSLKRNSLI